MNITLSLTEQEANTLIQLLDLAVKSQGLQVAGAALTFVTRVQESAAAAKTPSPTSGSNDATPS